MVKIKIKNLLKEELSSSDKSEIKDMFKKELDKINNFAKLDYILKGGDPSDVGAKIMPDGTIWSSNSDGTFTKIK